MPKHRELRIPLPDFSNVKAQVDEAHIAAGGAMNRHPRAVFWILLVLALAGGKLLAQMGR